MHYSVERVRSAAPGSTYTYGSASWKDLLTAFNGEKIVYEGQTMNEDGSVTGTPVSGNPIRYYNGTPWNFSWAEGRSLKTAESSTPERDISMEFSYDADGLRIEKRVTKTVYEMTDHTHTFTDTVAEPTCVKAGYTLHECDCGYSYTDNETAALGHHFGMADANGTRVCKRCGYVQRSTARPTTVTPSQEICSLEEPTEPEVPLQNEPDEPADDTLEEPETPDTPPTGNAPLHRGEAKETITETHQYIYAGRKLLRETISDGTTTKTLDFTYDNVGMPYSLIYNDGTTTTKCYYITNLQGDVMYLVDANGVQVAAYDYDPYGKVITSTGDLAEINPLRYRGYYYDTETSFYYLQSRYYDPEICRFINADGYSSTGAGFLGYNMFAYCNNNPIAFTDDNGGAPWWAIMPDWGFIHRLVQADIINEYKNLNLGAEVTCTTGRMDLFSMSTHEVWEIKSAGPTSLLGPMQLAMYASGKYIDEARIEHDITIGIATFSREFDFGSYHIKYWSSPIFPGLILYDFDFKEKQKELATVSVVDKQEQEKRSVPYIPSAQSSASASFSFGAAIAAGAFGACAGLCGVFSKPDYRFL